MTRWEVLEWFQSACRCYVNTFIVYQSTDLLADITRMVRLVMSDMVHYFMRDSACNVSVYRSIGLYISFCVHLIYGHERYWNTHIARLLLAHIWRRKENWLSVHQMACCIHMLTSVTLSFPLKTFQSDDRTTGIIFVWAEWRFILKGYRDILRLTNLLWSILSKAYSHKTSSPFLPC